MRYIRQFIVWLGQTRSRLLFTFLAITGLLSLILNAVRGKDTAWVAPAQSALVFAFLVSAALIIGSRLSGGQRKRAILIVGPALFSVGLALLLPSFALLFLPMAAGWIVVSYIASQSRMRSEYQAAIKHLRKDEYDEAIEIMSELIKAEPDNIDHRRFRAELYRLAGKVKKARGDYLKVIELLPSSGVGYNGLAEVYLQDGEYEAALGYAQKAYELEKDFWIAPYNLGMIEDRLEHTADSIIHLKQALAVKVPDSRHRLLTHLWLARGYVRQGDEEQAEQELSALRREQDGLNEWKHVFESEQAAVLRAVLQDDVTLADKLLKGEIELDALNAPSIPVLDIESETP